MDWHSFKNVPVSLEEQLVRQFQTKKSTKIVTISGVQTGQVIIILTIFSHNDDIRGER